MAQKVMRKADGEVATVLAEYGEHYWLNTPEGDVIPWTSPKSQWEEPTPRTGDVWQSAANHEYRVIGVDEVNKQYLIVAKEKYADGEWPRLDPGDLQRSAEIGFRSVYVRRYPEDYMELVSRLA